jgi:hypothetical protein
MFSRTGNDRAARDKAVDDLRAKIRKEKALLRHRAELDEFPDEDEPRPYRAKRISEVFESMGFGT